MIENKRFTTNGYKIYDTFHDGMHWLVNEVEAEEIVEIMNNLDTKARERSKALGKLEKENEQLKQHQRTLEAKIVRLKDRVKTFEKNYSLKDIERYKKMENCNCITSKRLEE